MHLIVAANNNKIGKIRDSFIGFASLKGTFPKIKNCHDIVKESKYDSNGNKRKLYPLNVTNRLLMLSKENDIIVIPIDRKLINALIDDNRFERVFLYDEHDDFLHKTIIDFENNKFFKKFLMTGGKKSKWKKLI